MNFPATLASSDAQYFNSTRQLAANVRVALKWQGETPIIPYLHGMMAFAYEQCHLLTRRSRRHERPLAMRRKSRGATCAGARAACARRIDGGRSFSRDGDTWTDLNSSCHGIGGPGSVLSQPGADGSAGALRSQLLGSREGHSQDQIGAVRCSPDWKSPASMSGRAGQDLGRSRPHARISVLPFLPFNLYGCGTGGAPRTDTF